MMGEIIRLKVYCMECQFFGVAGQNEICAHQKNKGSWKSANALQIHPSDLNAGNDCTWFRKKEVDA